MKLKMKFKKMSLFIFFLLLYPIIVSAKEFNVNNLINIKADHDYYITNTHYESDGIIVTGYTKANPNNLDNKDSFIRKYDKNYNLLWETFYGGNKDDIIMGSYIDNNGNIVGMLYTYSTNLGFTNKYTDTVFIRVSKDDGSIIEKKPYIGVYDDYSFGLNKTDDDGCIVYGYGDETGFPDVYNARIMKFDKNFNLEWSNRVGGTSTDIGVNLTFYNDTYYLVGQFTSKNLGSETRLSSNYTGFISAFDKDGNKLWEHLSNDTNNNLYHDVIVNDNKLIVSNSFIKRDDKSAISFKIYDLDGNYIENKEIDNYYDTVINKFVKSKDGGYILTAQIYDPTDIEGFTTRLGDVGFIRKLDNNFNTEYTIPLESEKSNQVLNIIELGNDKYIVGEQKFDLIDHYLKNNTIDISIVEPKKYNITSNINNGNITINSKAFEGENIKFKLTPNDGYELDSISVKDKNDNDIEVNDNSFIMPSGDVKINVNYKKKIYTITTEITISEVIDNSEVKVEYGDNKILNISTKYGYKLKKLYINNIDYTNEIVDNKINLNNINENLNISVEYEKITYNALNAVYSLNSSNVPLISLDANKEIDKVYLNDILLDKDDYEYEIKNNKLILKISDNYLNKLDNNEYQVKIITDDGGEAISKLNIIKEVEVPKTNDNILANISLFISSILGLLILKKILLNE